jgi:hypothetical protein
MRFSVHLSGDDHRDFGDSEVVSFARWLTAEFGARPPTGQDAVLISQGGEPERLTRAELVAWLHDSGLRPTARQVERLAVPVGHAVCCIVADEGVRLRAIDVRDLAPVVDDLEVDDAPRPRGATALGLGLIGGVS